MTKVSRFTRGPWKVLTKEQGCRDIGGAKSGTHKQAQYKTIASTHGVGGYADDGDEEDRGNAVLMAAAPDLLAFARLLASYECGCSGDVLKDSCAACGPCQAAEYLRRTGLDNAEGR